MGFVVTHRCDFQFSETKFAAHIIVQKILRWRFTFHIGLGSDYPRSRHRDLNAFKPDIIAPEAILECRRFRYCKGVLGSNNGHPSAKSTMSPQPSGLVNFLQRRSSGRKVKSCSRPPTRSGANCDGMTRFSLSAQRKIARHSYPASSPSGMPSWPVPFGHRLRSMCAMADSIALVRVAGFFESSIITTHPLKMGALQTEINFENKNARRSWHYVKLLLTRGANLRIWMVALLSISRLWRDKERPQ